MVAEPSNPYSLIRMMEGAEPPHSQIEDDALSPDRLISRLAADIQPRDVDWLWQNWLPRGMLSLLAGYGGSGKSTLALGLAAALSTNGRFPDGARAPLGKVAVLAAEDTAEHVTVPRLVSLNADLGKVFLLDGVEHNGEPGWLSVRSDVAALEQFVRSHGIDLLVIDPISSYVGDADGNAEHDVRPALMPLVAMAERTGVAILAIRHTNKNGDGRAAGRILGSVAWHDVPRSVLMMADAPPEHQQADGTTRRVLEVMKSNLAARPAPRMAVHGTDHQLAWMAEPSPCSIEDCLVVTTPKRRALPEAATWLTDLLSAGPLTQKAVEEAAAMKFSMATVRRGKTKAGVESVKIGHQWWWRLTGEDEPIPQGEKSEHLAS